MRRTAPALVSISLAFVLAGVAPPALAQTEDQQGLTKGKILELPELSEFPLAIPSLGVSVRPPVEAFFEMTAPGTGMTGARMWPQDPEESWEITVLSSSDGGRRATSGDVLETLIRAHQAQFVVADPRALNSVKDLTDPRLQKLTMSRILEHQKRLKLEPSGMRGERAYLEVPAKPDIPSVGYTVLALDQGEFLVFRLEAPKEDFSQARLMYETVIAACTFRDRTDLKSERAAPAIAGARLLEGIGRPELDAVFTDRDQFYRLYKPAVENSNVEEQEIAWQQIATRKGQLGELDPTRPRRQWTKAEREYGYLVQVTSRVLRGERMIDSVGMFFLSADLDSERWSLRSEVKEGSTLLTSNLQTVVRRGRLMTVVSEQKGQPASSIEYELPENHISKVLLYMLPEFVALKKLSGHFAFYNYDPGLGRVTLRHEVFEPLPQGGIKQSTRYSEDSGIVESVLDSSGRIVRQEMLGAQVMEPIQPGALRSLWRRKGLQTK